MDDAELIVSELFTNAVHASDDQPTLVSLRLFAADRQLLIMVWDANPRMPVRRDPAPDDLDGRGLLIVDALADACGTTPGLDGGKIVWARLAIS
jgi:anti-sigma regulatory factor (Ser/Thr protein kinase)